MRHVFVATKMGWAKERDCIWFDADYYTQEEAEAQFVPVNMWVEKNGHDVPFTAYEYDGVTYHHFYYLGLYDEDNMPQPLF